jgi:DNA-binding MurR/RpiR family transcriptional regulator
MPIHRKERAELHAKIAAYVQRHPEMTIVQIAGALGMSETTVGKAARAHGIARIPGRRPYAITPDMLAKLEG